MSEQVLQRGNAVERSRTRTIAQVAMLGAVAGVLMNLEFPIPFLAPSFYQLDFSEVPVMVGTFAMVTCGRYSDRACEDSRTSCDQGNHDCRCW